MHHVEFMQRLRQEIEAISNDDHPILKDKLPNCSVNNKKLMCLYLQALLAELYECGNCGEQSAVLFISYLKNGLVGQGIHRICLSGKRQQDNGEDNHGFVLFCDPDNVKDMKKWANGVVADTWESTLKLTYLEDKPITLKEITGDYFHEDSIGEIQAISFTQCLTVDDLAVLQKLLEILKELITVEVIFNIKYMLSDDFQESLSQASEEHQKIQDKIDQEIRIIQWLTLYAKINHVSVANNGYFGSCQKAAAQEADMKNDSKSEAAITLTPFEF